jgi:hypothetical protein
MPDNFNKHPSVMHKYAFFNAIVRVCYCALFLNLLSVMENIHAEEATNSPLVTIFNQSGLSTQIEFLPEIIEAEIVDLLKNQRKKNQLKGKNLQYFVDIVRQSYTVEDMSRIILAYLDEQLSPSDRKLILQWLNSKLGRHFTYLEAQSSKAEKIDEMRQFVRNLGNSPPTEKRLDLIYQLNQLTHATKSALIVLMSSKLSRELIKLQLHAASKKPNLDSVTKRVVREQNIVEREITAMVVSGLLYTYRTVSDQNLQTYINFASSEIGRIYHQVIFAGYNRAVVSANLKFAQVLNEN